MPLWPSGAVFSIWKEAGERALNLRLIFLLLACGNSKQAPWFINNDCISSLRECKGISRSRLMKLIPSDCIVNVTRVQYSVCYWKMLMLFLAVTGHSFNQRIFIWGLKKWGAQAVLDITVCPQFLVGALMGSAYAVCILEASKECIQLKAKMQIQNIYRDFKDDGFPCFPSLQRAGIFNRSSGRCWRWTAIQRKLYFQ